MDYQSFENYCYNEFADYFDSQIVHNFTREELIELAKKHIHPEDFLDETSPLAHKGPRWVAFRVARNMGLRK